MLIILQGDAIEQLRGLPPESVHCCVTSPPYWGLRDYGTAQWEGGDGGCDHLDPKATQRNDTATMYGENSQHLSLKPFNGDCGKCGAKRIDSQLGLEKTPEEYVAKMVEVFREVRRVLRKDGTLWLNFGDSYAGSGKGAWDRTDEWPGLKPKDLCGIPWRVAFALQADGWWLRSDIIWAKPNPMPESVTDRPTKAHEYLFLLTKSANYFYDAEAIKEQTSPFSDFGNPIPSIPCPSVAGDSVNGREIHKRLGHGSVGNPSGRNKRSVWTVATAPYPEAHFATYPPDLIKPCIMAGTSAKGCCAKCGSPWERIVERGQLLKDDGSPVRLVDPIKRDGSLSAWSRPGGKVETVSPNSHYENKTICWAPNCVCGPELEPCTVLDPFAGSGTTGAVALELGRKAILIELNPKYVQLIKDRCNITPGLQLA